MKYWVLLFLLFLYSVARADILVVESKTGNDRIVLEDIPCTSPIGRAFRHDLKPMEATYVWSAKKKIIKGCYILDNVPPHGDVVIMLFEDGDQMALPLSVFHKGDASAKRVGLII